MNISHLLKQHHIHITPSRKATIEILLNSANPIDVSTLVAKLRENIPSVDKATVFRTIKLFTKKSIVHKLEFGEGKFRYELASLPHHFHVICTKCGTVKDVAGCRVENMEKETAQKLAFDITNHRVDFFGLCSMCQ